MKLATLLVAAALALAGCNGEPPPPPPEAADADIQVIGEAGLKFDTEQFSATAGEETSVALESHGVTHDFTIEGVDDGDDLMVVEAGRDETGVGRFTLDEPGTYTVFCSVPGHREAGMTATLAVTE